MNIRPKKSLGQNFLVDRKAVRDLVEAAEVGPEDVVVEVGAGTGVMTKELAKRAKRVIAVEFDRDLVPVLEKELKEFKNVEIVNQDVLDLRFTDHLSAEALAEADGLRSFKIIGSIPYQITSPLIHKLLIEKPRPSLIIFLVQLEVAEKICSQPPKATYFSNFVQAFGEAKIVRKVSPSAFKPQPKVNSAILKIKPEGFDSAPDARHFSEFLHQGFKSPRKMLNKVFPKKVLESAGVDDTRRPQTLTIGEWMRLYKRTRNAKLQRSGNLIRS